MDNMLKLSMFDHVFAGPILTWTNHQEVSDHSPIHIQLQQVDVSRPKPFKFFNFWTSTLHS